MKCLNETKKEEKCEIKLPSAWSKQKQQLLCKYIYIDNIIFVWRAYGNWRRQCVTVKGKMRIFQKLHEHLSHLLVYLHIPYIVTCIKQYIYFVEFFSLVFFPWIFSFTWMTVKETVAHMFKVALNEALKVN